MFVDGTIFWGSMTDFLSMEIKTKDNIFFGLIFGYPNA